MEGNQETILEPDLAIIDAHHHLIDTDRHSYTIEKYKQDCVSGHNIVGSVYIEVRENIIMKVQNGYIPFVKQSLSPGYMTVCYLMNRDFVRE